MDDGGLQPTHCPSLAGEAIVAGMSPLGEEHHIDNDSPAWYTITDFTYILLHRFFVYAPCRGSPDVKRRTAHDNVATKAGRPLHPR
ncbi:MAG: hypothetical protein NVS4B8_06910 [Herpetosiphon sp.]